ncbi:MAG: response regulator [Vicinamibacteria bacterium]|nr:response regulator [Vicinamibacteria bacterium]
MKRVLIVEDEAEGRYLLRVLLSADGWKVEEARHGAEALARARRSPPDLVVSDLLMPVMDGYTLLRHWKADPRLGSVPFVVYTATYTEPADEALARDLGADAFILKPAEPAALTARLAAFMEAAHETAARAPNGDVEASRKAYEGVIVRKLEEKVEQLQQANRALEEDVAERRRAESRVAEQLSELQRWHRATVGRESRVLELKSEVNALLAELGRPPRYASVATDSVQDEPGPRDPGEGA